MRMINRLLDRFGLDLCELDEQSREVAATDLWDVYAGCTACILRPRTTQDVAYMLEFCHLHGIDVVPQGGNTGLSGGAIPDASGTQVVLSLARLNRVREVDAENDSMTVEAGCILANIQQQAANAGRLFPLTLGAEGSCQIGGVISTNAGGNNVLRYGSTRDLILGLEVVLADGMVWNGLRKLRKNNSGYDLKQLFIGAEGTLGVVTAAVLKLFPQPRSKVTAFVALDKLATVPLLLAAARQQSGDAINAFELMSKRTIDLVCDEVQRFHCVPQAQAQWYALIEFSSADDDVVLAGKMQNFLEHAFTEEQVLDAVIAQSLAQQADMWALRDGVSEAQKKHGAVIYFDVSVPVSSVPRFIDEASARLREHDARIDISAFGHAGDGNIHFNILQDKDQATETFLAQRLVFERLVYAVVAEMDGSFSAEHGVGQGKLAWMEEFKSATELELMRQVRKAFDSAHLNPGKLIPD